MGDAKLVEMEEDGTVWLNDRQGLRCYIVTNVTYLAGKLYFLLAPYLSQEEDFTIREVVMDRTVTAVQRVDDLDLLGRVIILLLNERLAHSVH